MSGVTDWLSGQTSYAYDSAGRLTKTQYPNTVWADYTYDSADRLTSVVNKKTGAISSFTYGLDAVGNRTQMVDLSGTHSYQYDALYRLKEVTYPGPLTHTYQHDANGNRTFKNATSYSHDAADQLTETGGVSYGYDNNGNQTSRGSDTFGFDHENRMTTTSIGGVSGTYAYDGDGLRRSRNIGGANVSYIWDVAAGLPVTLQDSQGNTYVYGLDLISRTDSGGSQEYYLHDGLGSTTDLINGSGTTNASYSYDVFGGIRSQTGDSGNEFKFTGEQVDTTSLQYLRARYYDAGTGRFLSGDPLPAGNLYIYVGNNPLTLVDPYGLIGCKNLPLGKKECEEVTGVVEETVRVVTNAMWDTFGPPYNTTKIIQILDVLPIAEACGLAAVLITAETGLAALAAGYSAMRTCDTLIEDPIAIAASAATWKQIASSDCPAAAKADAATANWLNTVLDTQDFSEPFEAFLLILGNESLECQDLALLAGKE